MNDHERIEDAFRYIAYRAMSPTERAKHKGKRWVKYIEQEKRDRRLYVLAIALSLSLIGMIIPTIIGLIYSPMFEKDGDNQSKAILWTALIASALIISIWVAYRSVLRKGIDFGAVLSLVVFMMVFLAPSIAGLVASHQDTQGYDLFSLSATLIFFSFSFLFIVAIFGFALDEKRKFTEAKKTCAMALSLKVEDLSQEAIKKKIKETVISNIGGKEGDKEIIENMKNSFV